MSKADERADDEPTEGDAEAAGRAETEGEAERNDEPKGDAPRPSAPKKKTKAKAKASPDEDDDDDAPRGPRGRLSFARDFPPSVALDELLAAFDRGDYARVRALAPALAKNERPDVARAARDVARRIEPDRTVLALLGISIALLAVLAIWFWTHRLGAHP